MAEVPYDRGVPSAEPTAAPPDDYQHIQTSPEQFGGALARGLQKAGEGAQQAGKFYGQVAADDASNNYQASVDKILHGDPTKIGENGEADLGYLGLRGAAALRARPEVEKQLEQAKRDAGKGLLTAEQQLQFDNFSRRYHSYAVGQVGTHAERSATEWYGAVEDDSAKLAMTHIANNPLDAKAVASGANDLIAARLKKAQRLGADLENPNDPVVKQTVEQARRDALEAQTRAIAVSDPSRAQRILEKNRDIAGTRYDELSAAFRARADWQNGRALGDGALNPAGVQTPSQIADDIIGKAKPTAAPPQAVKPGETLPPLKVGEVLLGANERGQRDVLSRFIGNVGGQKVDPALTPWCAAFVNAVLRESGLQGTGSLAARSFLNVGTPVALPQPGDVVVFSRGGDPSKGHVAFYAGPGSTPGMIKVLGGNQNDQVSYAEYPQASVVGIRRMGPDDVGKTPVADTAAPTQTKGDAYRRLFASTEYQNATPEAQAHARSYVAQEIQARQIAADQGARAQKEQSDQAAFGYSTELYDSLHNPAGADMVALAGRINHDPKLEWRTKDALMDRLKRFSGEEEMMTYGPGYSEVLGRMLSPSTDPDHIGSFADVVARRDLTNAGLKALSERVNLARKSPDHASIEKRLASFLTGIKKYMAIDEDNGMGFKIRNPEGERVFNWQIQPEFVKRVSEMEKKAAETGNYKELDNFLSEKGVRDFVDGMYDKHKVALAKMQAEYEATGKEPAGMPPPPVPAGADPKGWDAVMKRRPLTADGSPQPYAIWGKKMQLMAENPTADMAAAFDKSRSSVSGLTGAEIIKQLTGIDVAPPKAAAPPEPQQPAKSYSIHDTSGPGPAGYVRDLLGGFVPKTVKDYVQSAGER